MLGDRAVEACVTQIASSDGAPLDVTIVGGHGDETTVRYVRAALERMLGLGVDLSGFAAMAARDPVLGPVAERLRGLHPPRFPSVFEALVNAIACQQLSLTVGIHLLDRLAAAHGRPPTGVADGPCAFPQPEELAAIDPAALRPLGFSTTKAETIVATARAIDAGTLDLEGLDAADDGAALERLTALRGIGRWSAEYVLLRGLGRLNVFPGDDVGARHGLERLMGVALPDSGAVRDLVARWEPYAGLVYLHMLVDSLVAAISRAAR